MSDGDIGIYEFATHRVRTLVSDYGRDRPTVRYCGLSWLTDDIVSVTEAWQTSVEVDQSIQEPPVFDVELGARTLDLRDGATLSADSFGTHHEGTAYVYVAGVDRDHWLVADKPNVDRLRLYTRGSGAMSDAIAVIDGPGQRFHLEQPMPWVLKILGGLAPGQQFSNDPVQVEFVNALTGAVKRIANIPVWSMGAHITSDGRYVLTARYDVSSQQLVPIVVAAETGTWYTPRGESWQPAAISEARGMVLVACPQSGENQSTDFDWYEVPLSAIILN